MSQYYTVRTYAQTVSHKLTISCKCISRLTICTFADIFFFKILFRKKLFHEYRHSVSSLDPDQPDVLSGLIWVQAVCKGYQQMALVGKDLNKQEDPRVWIAHLSPDVNC